jgi:hypothetical protein
VPQGEFQLVKAGRAGGHRCVTEVFPTAARW